MRTIYKASFSVGPKAPDTLEILIRTARKWVFDKLNRSQMSEFRTGLVIEEKNRTLQTISVDDDGTRYFAMKFEETDQDNPDRVWRTCLSAKEPELTIPKVGITLESGWKTRMLKPGNEPSATRPLLVPMILKKESLQAEDDYPLSAKSIPLPPDSTEEFLERLFSDERMLPLIMVSCSNATGRPTTDPDKLAFYLAGLAHVYATTTHNMSDNLKNALQPKGLNCYDGAVRIYWPIRERDEIAHRYFVTDTIKDFDRVWPGGFAGLILDNLSTLSLSRDMHITYEEVRKLKQKQDIQNALADRDVEEIIAVYSRDVKTLSDNLEEKELEILEKDDKIAALEQRIFELEGKSGSLEKTVARLAANGPVPDAPRAPNRQTDEELRARIRTPLDAVTEFEAQYPSSSVVILQKAKKQAGKSPYKHPFQIYQALRWLEENYRTPEDKKLTSKELTGLEYVPSQSELTMKKYEHDYKLVHEKKVYWLKEHLSKGTSTKPEDTLRIAFAYDAPNDRFLVGFIGQHQQTEISN